jgi:hypothetical protein
MRLEIGISDGCGGQGNEALSFIKYKGIRVLPSVC